TCLTGFVDYSQLTAYKRTIHGTPFFEPCATVWNAPYLDVSVTSFSEIILGGPEESTLPVELSSFTASINAQNNVSLNWITQSETGVIGFNVYRAPLDDLECAQLVSPLINATNTSTTQSYVYVDKDLYEPGEYYYWLQNVDLDGSMAFHGPISITYTGNDSNHSPNIGPVDGINQTYPNPFNPNVFISYGLTKAAKVDLAIYNLRGQLVSRLVDAPRESGSYRVIWNGIHDSGSACSSGVYIVRMTAGGKTWSSRIMLVK
ncbi:MAG TPA: T9SS type A sorting domain-containing protein, partial [Candidatus Cloacimonadota bacterium]|nr:T9SS type A sorting domain-containing protein [Candidatus Cloacimonadota bacterium]